VSVGFSTPPPEPPPLEHALWRLTKGARVVEARARQVPFGIELRISVDRELVWSRVYRDGHGHLLGEESNTKEGEFKALGWAAGGQQR
jgi:hypothetical protein